MCNGVSHTYPVAVALPFPAEKFRFKDTTCTIIANDLPLVCVEVMQKLHGHVRVINSNALRD